MTLSEADSATVKLLESRARSLLAARRRVGDGDCQERAIAALEESSAILKDAAKHCRRYPAMNGSANGVA